MWVFLFCNPTYALRVPMQCDDIVESKEKGKTLKIYSLYPTEEEWFNELWGTFSSAKSTTVKQIEKKIVRNFKKLGYSDCLILISDAAKLYGEFMTSESKLSLFIKQCHMDGIDSKAVKKSIFYAVENVSQHASGKSVLVVFFKVLSEKMAEFTFASLDYGDGFINKKNGRIMPIDEAVNLGNLGKEEKALTNIEKMSHRLAITEVHELKNKREGFYWVKYNSGNIEKGKLNANELEKLPVRHGTKVIFVRQVKGHFSPRTTGTLYFPSEPLTTGL